MSCTCVLEEDTLGKHVLLQGFIQVILVGWDTSPRIVNKSPGAVVVLFIKLDSLGLIVVCWQLADYQNTCRCIMGNYDIKFPGGIITGGWGGDSSAPPPTSV